VLQKLARFGTLFVLKTFAPLSLLTFSCLFLSKPLKADPLTLYGRANVSLQLSDDGDGSYSDLSSNASRVGVKGELSLDNELSVIYQLEWEVDLADLSGSDNIKSRDQYVGLKSQIGTVFLGRKNSFTKIYSANVDLFNDYQGDLKRLWKGENRLSESVAYESNSINGFQFGISYKTKGAEEGQDGMSMGVRYGDVKLKNSTWNAALTVDSDINGYDIIRASIQTKLADIILSAMAHRQKNTEQGTSDSGFLLSAQYSVNLWKFKSQIQTLEDNNAFSIGADYQLGKSTKVYTWYTLQSLEQIADKSWLALGLEHRF
jgi:predicted porin